MADNHTPGQWPSGTQRPTGSPKLRPRHPAQAQRGVMTAPTVQAELTVDLSGISATRNDMSASVAEQLRGDLTGMHVRVIVGDSALGDSSLPRLIAGRSLGAASISVAAARDALRHEVRWFTEQLNRECALVLTDHLQMLREAQQTASSVHPGE